MIRVLHVIDHLGLGGAQSALLDMVRDATAVEAEVAVMHGRGIFADALEKAGIKTHVLAPSKWPPVYISNLLRLVRTGGFDVLHFHLQGANWLGKPLCALVSRAPRVAHDHSSADLRFRGRWSLLPDGIAHLFSHRVVAVSAGVADFLSRHEAVPHRKIRVVANGVDTGLFMPASVEARTRARDFFGLSSDDFVVGALGRLAPEKNFGILAPVARMCPDVRFIIGGAGPEEAALRRSFEKLSNCVLAGQITDRAKFYAALDAFVLPSLHEALPMTILEAMASGVPVVASNLEGVASALGDGGLLVPPGNAQEIAAQIRVLQSDPVRRRALVTKARKRVEERFSAAATARSLAAIYREVLRN